MKRLCLVALATILVALQGIAQGQTKMMTPEQREAHKKEMNEQRCKQLATSLALDDATSVKFIDTYTRFNNEMGELRRKYKMHRPNKGEQREGQTTDMLTDAQVEENILNRFALSRSIVDVREKYYKEFRKFMNPKQIQHLYNLEKERGEHLREQHKRAPQEGFKRGPQGGFNRPMPR